MDGAVWLLVIGVAVGLLLIPGIIASSRRHQYQVVIWILTITSPIFFGVTWLVALIWAAWPKGKTIADPFIGTVDSNSKRNLGTSFGETSASFNQGASRAGQLENRLMEIERLHSAGKITEEEKAILRSKAFEQF